MCQFSRKGDGRGLAGIYSEVPGRVKGGKPVEVNLKAISGKREIATRGVNGSVVCIKSELKRRIRDRDIIYVQDVQKRTKDGALGDTSTQDAGGGKGVMDFDDKGSVDEVIVEKVYQERREIHLMEFVN